MKLAWQFACFLFQVTGAVSVASHRAIPLSSLLAKQAPSSSPAAVVPGLASVGEDELEWAAQDAVNQGLNVQAAIQDAELAVKNASRWQIEAMNSQGAQVPNLKPPGLGSGLGGFSVESPYGPWPPEHQRVSLIQRLSHVRTGRKGGRVAEAIGNESSISKSTSPSSACSDIADARACSDDVKCFPHFTSGINASLKDLDLNGGGSTCVQAEEVECHLPAPGDQLKMKALFLSDGVSNADLNYALLKVLQERPLELPDIVVITDACFLKQFKEVDRFPCETWSTTFDERGIRNVIEISILEKILGAMPKDDHTRIVNSVHNLAGGRLEPGDPVFPTEGTGKLGQVIEEFARRDVVGQRAVKHITDIIAKAGVLAINGGDPDVLGFALRLLGDDTRAEIRQRVQDGQLIFIGRSAGAMSGGKSHALSLEPKVALDVALNGVEGHGLRTDGLRLIGQCAIRPHYKQETWDVAAELDEKVEWVKVVRIPNGEGMACFGDYCKMVGFAQGRAPHRQGATAYGDIDDWPGLRDPPQRAGACTFAIRGLAVVVIVCVLPFLSHPL